MFLKISRKKKDKTDWGHIQVTDTDKNNNDN